MGVHSKQTAASGNHVLQAWHYANAADRAAHVPAVGNAEPLTANDVGKSAKQLDDSSFWILVNHSPITWSKFAPLSDGSGDVVGPPGATDEALVRFNLGTGKLVQNGLVTEDDQGRVKQIKTATYQGEHDNGNSGAAITIDWNNGQKQKLTLSANCSLSISNPAGACNLILKVVQDVTGGRTITWPGSVRWAGGSPPVLTATGNGVDLVALYFDGAVYYSVVSLNFL